MEKETEDKNALDVKQSVSAAQFNRRRSLRQVAYSGRHARRGAGLARIDSAL